LKKRKLELEREELQRKRRELEFEEELKIAEAREQLEVGEDDNEVVSFFRESCPKS
jgi:hypothetical protein